MNTINGKLINQERKKAQKIQIQIENILEDVKKLEPVLGQHNQQIKSTISALKYLEERLNSIENNRLDSLQIRLEKLEKKLINKLVTITTISIVGLGSLWGWFFLNNNPSYSQPENSSQRNSELIIQNSEQEKERIIE